LYEESRTSFYPGCVTLPRASLYRGRILKLKKGDKITDPDGNQFTVLTILKDGVSLSGNISSDVLLRWFAEEDEAVAREHTILSEMIEVLCLSTVISAAAEDKKATLEVCWGSLEALFRGPQRRVVQVVSRGNGKVLRIAGQALLPRARAAHALEVAQELGRDLSKQMQALQIEG